MEKKFPSEWVPTIALIHQNEYGFRMSVILIKRYITKAEFILEIQKKNHIIKNTVDSLKKRVADILGECALFDEFHTEYEHFRDKTHPENIPERITKKIFILYIWGQLVFFHQMLAHHVQELHSDICHILLKQDTQSIEYETFHK